MPIHKGNSRKLIAMTPAFRKCMSCRERSVSPTTLSTYSAELEHDGRKYAVTVNDFRVLRCQQCGAIVLDDSANESLSRALRREAGLLQPEEIHANRETLRLTQKQLAGYLRISESTLSRWETGAQIQQRAMDALLRVFFNSSEARSILAGSSGAVPNPPQTRLASMPLVGKTPSFSTEALVITGAMRLGVNSDDKSTDRAKSFSLAG